MDNPEGTLTPEEEIDKNELDDLEWLKPMLAMIEDRKRQRIEDTQNGN